MTINYRGVNKKVNLDKTRYNTVDVTQVLHLDTKKNYLKSSSVAFLKFQLC